MALPDKYLIVIQKELTDNKGGFYLRSEIVTDDKEIVKTGVEIEFRNLGLFHAIVNNNIYIVGAYPVGAILEQYGNVDSWKSNTLLGQNDLTIYKVKFQKDIF